MCARAVPMPCRAVLVLFCGGAGNTVPGRSFSAMWRPPRKECRNWRGAGRAALVKAKNGDAPAVSDFPSLGSIGKRRHTQVGFQCSAERLPWDFKASSGQVIASLNCFAPIAMSAEID
jgi:hypothetical protein